MNHQEALTEQIFTLVDALYSKGMTEIVISPGSRSTPIAIACECHPHIKTYIHPDERGAGFFALGLSKASKQPVGILCTSGTAAANYVPSVSEAGLMHIPLVVLTSDRPHELRDVGAPQAIKQTNMFSNYVKFETELPIADESEYNMPHVEDRVLQASQYFDGILKGPVHINIPVREPLMPNINRTDFFFREQLIQESITVESNIEPLLGNGLVIIGETDCSLEKIDFEKYKQLTFIMDPRVSERTKLSRVVTTHDLIFMNLTDEQRNELESQFDFILRIGEAVTSKSTNQFLKQTSLKQILISEFIDVKTFPKTPDVTYVGDVKQTLDALLIESDHSVDVLYEVDRDIKQLINDEIENYDDEGRYMYEIIKRTNNDRTLFVSSSMPIRDFERYDAFNRLNILANRGANGIDGVVSTAFGVGTKMPMTLIIGDVSLNHDINGLVMSKLEEIDGTVICFNNNGGNIFSYLPQKEHDIHFERLFGTPLDLDFSHAAKLYGFNYHLIKSVDDLTEEILNQKGRNFIEIKTDREDNVKQHNDLKQKVKALVQHVKF